MAPKAIPAAMLSSVSRILKRCKFAASGCGGSIPRAQVDLGTYIYLQHPIYTVVEAAMRAVHIMDVA